jgi:hypothetical protein
MIGQYPSQQWLDVCGTACKGEAAIANERMHAWALS